MKTLKERLKESEFPAYVHTYPTNRLYEPVDNFSLDQLVLTNDVNIYLHIPFCEQKCAFCGYLTTIDGTGTFQDDYVASIIGEIEMYKRILKEKNFPTVHFGGGTPSLLTQNQLRKIFEKLKEINPNIIEHAEEVSIEATPESVEYEKFLTFRQLGVNRVSIGIESMNDKEVKLSKRHNFSDVLVRSMEILRELGIPNICCDLIYGLEGQTIESWIRSVEDLLKFKPETVEIYSLMVKPMTGLGQRGKRVMGNKEKYDCYDIAREILLNAGYLQESQVRFILEGQGSHRQQENIFRGQSLVGFGAGSRSYAENIHYRNMFDRRFNRKAIVEYMQKLETGRLPVMSRVILDSEEKLRQYVIYNLEDVNKEEVRKRFGVGFDEKFADVKSELLDLGLGTDSSDRFQLTPTGLKYRDLIAREFFSDRVKQAEEDYWSRVQSKQTVRIFERPNIKLKN